MDRKTLIIISVAAIVVIAAYFAFGGGYSTGPGTGAVPQTAPK